MTMKNTLRSSAATLMAVAMLTLTGCAGMNANDAMNKVSSGIGTGISFASSAVNGVVGSISQASGLGQDYVTGTLITQEQMASLKKGSATKSQVIAAVGNPPTKSNVGGLEVWTYPYTMIGGMPGKPNVFESTIFEFRGNVLVNSYKAAGTPGKSGNPLLDAAGM